MLVPCVALLLCACRSRGSDSGIPTTVEDSGSKEVDALVAQLVSARPSPNPSGYGLTTNQAEMGGRYMTTEVSNAIVKLKGMGPPIYPALVQHLKDHRYSFSEIGAAWHNCTVGDAVLDVLSDGHYSVSGYKFRQASSGSYPSLSFKAYVNERDPEKWASWAKDKTRLAIQMDFIDWCVSKETERGFVDEAQRRHILGQYDEARERVRKEYATADTATEARQPAASETNQPAPPPRPATHKRPLFYGR